MRLAVDTQKVTEYVTHSWYSYPDESAGIHPSEGITDVNYTDLNANVFPPNSACILDSMGFEDLDGDSVIDFVCIGTVSGDYDDADHEVVAIHTPSGNRIWTTDVEGRVSRPLRPALCT